MKEGILLLLLVATFPVCAFGEPVTLAWDPPRQESEVSGYRLYFSHIRGQYQKSQMVDVRKATRYTIDLGKGRWYFVVTAYDKAGNESGYSNVVSCRIDDKQGNLNGSTKTDSVATKDSGNNGQDHVNNNPSRPLIPPSIQRPRTNDSRALIRPTKNLKKSGRKSTIDQNETPGQGKE